VPLAQQLGTELPGARGGPPVGLLAGAHPAEHERGVTGVERLQLELHCRRSLQPLRPDVASREQA
jgi:hypothetical protein